MKKVLAIFAITGILVACGGNEEKKAEDMKDGAEQMMNEVKDSATNKMNEVKDSATNMMNNAVDTIKTKM